MSFITCDNVCNPESRPLDTGCGFCFVSRIVRAPAAASPGLKDRKNPAMAGSRHSASNPAGSPRQISGCVHEGLRTIPATYSTGAITAPAACILAAGNDVRQPRAVRCTAGRAEQPKPRICYGRAQATFNDKPPTGVIIRLQGWPSSSRGSAGRMIFQGWPLGPGIETRGNPSVATRQCMTPALMTRPAQSCTGVKRHKQGLTRERRRETGDMHRA
jgi:hypothetical protein